VSGGKVGPDRSKSIPILIQ